MSAKSGAPAREPWMKFFPSDWRADPGLRMCGLAARGLWVEMLGVMHEAEPYGHLLVKGRPPTDQKLSVLVGCQPAELRRLKDELLEAGVPSIEDGIWMSRRMVRDAQRRAVNRENGKGGGNPALTDRKNNLSRLTGPDNRNPQRPVIMDRPPPCEGDRADRDPEARVQKPERNTPPPEAVNRVEGEARPGDLPISQELTLGRAFAAVLETVYEGRTIRANGGANEIHAARQILAHGFGIEFVLEAIEAEMRASIAKHRSPIQSLSYFVKVFDRLAAESADRPQIARQHGHPEPFIDQERSQWLARLKLWHERGTWMDSWPRRESAPPGIAAEAERLYAKPKTGEAA